MLTDESIRGGGKIMFNKILENGMNGINCSGANNYPVIKKNYKITYNHLAGIRVEEGASPTISCNEIFKNLTQGVLLVNGSWACIMKN